MKISNRWRWGYCIRIGGAGMCHAENLGVQGPRSAEPVSPSKTIGGKFGAFYISCFDSLTSLDYVADRAECSLWSVFAR